MYSPSVGSLSPRSSASTQQALSPRVSMLRHTTTQQAFRDSFGPDVAATSKPERVFDACKMRRDSFISPISMRSQSVHSSSPRSYQQQAASPALPCIQIANGTEFETESPISPTGTMLSYASNRAVDSGLLAVPALSEPQVAEYRFWVPCGRRVCGFGCGGVQEGESAAAKRLFREVESVTEQQDESEENVHQGEDDQFDQTAPVVAEEQARYNCPSTSFTKPIDEWRRFLVNKERDVSVAKF
ncbi:hypothetical protein E8E13_001085 [Curvularia kusanoi]|uniref:Uncharacterized protein n=1 Tax=Curvularia kusanoi TaxID=90978 RepID=A0A9P4T9A8_CURKU|nr:hypothetical protein E8E13_001085 [Curvularia kusanoi]